jgi:hypothetical protein
VVQHDAETVAASYRAQISSLEREFDEAQERDDQPWMTDVAQRLAGYRRLLAIAERPQ